MTRCFQRASPPKVGLPASVPNACLTSRLQFLMKSRRSTSAISVFLGFVLTDVTVYPAAVPLFNRAGGAVPVRVDQLLAPECVAVSPWEYVASPHRGARRLWSWQFDEFLGMVRRAAEMALAVRRAVSANKPPDDRFER